MASYTRYLPEDVSLHEFNYISKILDRYLKGVFISRESGNVLYSWLVDSDFKIELISQFIAALAMFGEENLGHIRRVYIEGLNIEIAIVTKHGLICTAVFNAEMVKDHLDVEGENLLDQFYQKFKPVLAENRCNKAIYEPFDHQFWNVIHNYLEHIGALDHFHPLV